jgi:hypothetical protein
MTDIDEIRSVVSELQEVAAARIAYLVKSIEDEPRDEHGRWTSGGSFSEPESFNVREHLTPKEYTDLHHWVTIGEDYENLRTSAEFKDLLDRIPQFQGTVYRGTRLSAEEVDKLNVGQVFSFSKTSSSTALAEQFAKQYMDLNINNTDFFSGNTLRNDSNARVMFEIRGAKGADFSKLSRVNTITGEGNMFKLAVQVHEVVIPFNSGRYKILDKQEIKTADGSYIRVTMTHE